MESSLLIGKLPPFQNKSVLVQGRQTVYDIINEVLDAHEIFAPDYNRIAADFWTGDKYTTAKKLFDFLRRNVRYKIETEGKQTTKSPAAMLSLGYGDCKHYAGFIGGVLDAINRIYNAKINFVYRFASYNFFDKDPAHVFIVIKDQGREIWIDPVLKNFDERVEPSYYLDKRAKANTMALTRISGFMEDVASGAVTAPANILLDTTPYASNPQYYLGIQNLLKYGVMDIAANVNDAKMRELQKSLLPDQYTEVLISYERVKANQFPIDNGQQVAGFFDDIWRSIKVVTLAAPRGAFLALVAINAFGYATKLKAGIWKPDGTYTTFKDKLKDIWQNKLGGQYSVLENTIRNGATHKAILGVTPAVVSAWAAAAAVCIAAIMPLLKTFLSTSNEIPQMNYDIDPTTGLPYGQAPANMDPLQWIKNNPAIVVGGVVVGYLLYKKFVQRKRAT